MKRHDENVGNEGNNDNGGGTKVEEEMLIKEGEEEENNNETRENGKIRRIVMKNRMGNEGIMENMQENSEINEKSELFG